jgi:lipid-A-disaccharide synthase
MLTLFPFEERFYREHGVPVHCVGHPMADLVADEVDAGRARRHLGIASTGPLVALLPGSRAGEVRRLAAPFVRTAAWCHERCRDMHFVVPLANETCKDIFETALARAGSGLPVTLLSRQSLEAMAAADAVLMASGTATLEAMLLKTPMAVAYRLSPLTYRIAQLLVRTRYISLPNLLADRPLVREFIQGEVKPESMGREILSLVEDRERTAEMAAVFERIHAELRRDANHAAAESVLEIVGRRHVAP